MANIITITKVLGPVATNCYIVGNTDTREAVIIDPADEAGRIIDLLTKENFKPVAILLTHGHFDHISGLPGLKKEYPDVKVYIGKDDKDVISNPILNVSAMFGTSVSMEAEEFVQENDVLDMLGTSIKCIHVPGHTKGGMCYYFEEEKIVFSGDTLFEYSIGRSDFPTGDGRALIDNIKIKLFTLPEDVIVYSGHGDRTTIGREKRENPYF